MVYLLPHSVQQSAEKFPDKEAFKCLNDSITYESLARKVNQLSNLLIELGIKKGDRVGIFLSRSLETAIAIYGIMGAGAVYVPFDPDAPPSRIQFLIEDCEIDILISRKAQKRALEKVIATGVALKHIIGIQREGIIPAIPWENLSKLPERKPDINILEHDLAYILYSSGSTGVPKGIMHTHHSGLSYAKISADLYKVKNTDRIGNHAPIYFDISTLGYFTAPYVGATTVIASESHIKMPASLAQLIAKEQLTIWYSVPLALIQILQRGFIESFDFSALRLAIYAGEPFPVKHLKKLMENWPNVAISNAYGPTEVNQCTYYNIPEIPQAETSIPLGHTWNNTEMLIVDEKDQLINKGEVGELLIRSSTMMQGYWKRPDLNAKAFYIDSKISGFQKVYYRTGDLVKLDRNNLLHFLGRKDRQVKIRGNRFELDELSTILLKYPNVSEVAVFASKDEKEETTIKVAVIPKGTTMIDPNELRILLSQHIPNYAIPKDIAILTTFPRTPTGKINYNALKEQLSAKS